MIEKPAATAAAAWGAWGTPTHAKAASDSGKDQGKERKSRVDARSAGAGQPHVAVWGSASTAGSGSEGERQAAKTSDHTGSAHQATPWSSPPAKTSGKGEALRQATPWGSNTPKPTATSNGAAWSSPNAGGISLWGATKAAEAPAMQWGTQNKEQAAPKESQPPAAFVWGAVSGEEGQQDAQQENKQRQQQQEEKEEKDKAPDHQRKNQQQQQLQQHQILPSTTATAGTAEEEGSPGVKNANSQAAQEKASEPVLSMFDASGSNGSQQRRSGTAFAFELRQGEKRQQRLLARRLQLEYPAGEDEDFVEPPDLAVCLGDAVLVTAEAWRPNADVKALLDASHKWQRAYFTAKALHTSAWFKAFDRRLRIKKASHCVELFGEKAGERTVRLLLLHPSNPLASKACDATLTAIVLWPSSA